MSTSIFKQPTALLPLAMSLAAVTLVLVHFAIYGIVHETDEGTPAHVFQLLMVLQLPLVAVFAATWLPRDPGHALLLLALQAAAGLAALASVFFFT